MRWGQWQVANLLHLVYKVVAVPLYGKIHMAEGEDRAMAGVPVNEPKAILLLWHKLCGHRRGPAFLCLSKKAQSLSTGW